MVRAAQQAKFPLAAGGPTLPVRNMNVEVITAFSIEPVQKVDPQATTMLLSDMQDQINERVVIDTTAKTPVERASSTHVSNSGCSLTNIHVNDLGWHEKTNLQPRA